MRCVLILWVTFFTWCAVARGQYDNITDPTVSALEFNGIHSYVDISVAVANFSFGDFTISGWFNIQNQNGATQYLFRFTGQRGSVNRIQVIEAGGTITADIRPAAGGPIYAISSTNFTYGNWVHIAFARRADQLYLYFNGQLVGSRTTVTNLFQAVWGFVGANTYNGKTWGVPANFYAGEIDEFQIRTNALSAQDISNSMSQSISPAAGLRAGWGFNERSGDLANDASGNGFAATIYNALWTRPMLVINNVEPQNGTIFYKAEKGMQFIIYPGENGVDRNDICLIVNGLNQSSQLKFSGTKYKIYARFGKLLNNSFYHAEIRVTDRQGRQIAKDVSFNTFTPSAYWWRAVWTGTVIGGVCLAVAFGWIIWGRRWRRRELQRFQSRLARDIHDEIGSNLAGIAVLSETARETSSTAAEQQKDWDDTNRIARETMEALREILLFTIERGDVELDLMNHMHSLTRRMLPKTEIQWKTTVNHLPVDWSCKDQWQIFLFFKEAITNIARHAHASRVELSVQILRGCFDLQIADNGRGFDLTRIKSGTGLHSQRMRIRMLKGTIEVFSLPGKGTKTHVLVPLRKTRKRWRSRIAGLAKLLVWLRNSIL
jgi:two-component sensor histidine kinase